MRHAGQMDLVVSLTYVPLLGIVGGIMLDESFKTLRAQARGNAPARIYPVNHVWIHGLPFKMRFRQSRLYISVIPPLVIGFLVGDERDHGHRRRFHHRAGDDLSPAHAHQCGDRHLAGADHRRDDAITTILQATNNYAVDIVLAAILVVGRGGWCAVGRARRRQAAAASNCACCWRWWCWRWRRALLWQLLVRPVRCLFPVAGAP